MISRLSSKGFMLCPPFVLVLILSAGISGCHFNMNVNLIPPKGPLKEVVISGTGEDRVLIIPVEGVISGATGSSLSGGRSSGMLDHVSAQLAAARKDKRIKAVVLKIDSSGGVVSVCDAIYEELKRYKKETKTAIVAQHMSIATSGGYYISMAADKILAQPTAVTGSIGVILVKMNAKGLLEKVGIENDSLKSGKSKDMLSVFKEMTPEGRALAQKILDSMHKRFIAVVLSSRPDVKDQETSFDGRAFIAPEALERNLIDKLGYLQDSIEEAKKLAGLSKATVIRFSPSKGGGSGGASALVPNNYQAALDVMTPLAGQSLFPPESPPQFLYFWTP